MSRPEQQHLVEEEFFEEELQKCYLQYVYYHAIDQANKSRVQVRADLQFFREIGRRVHKALKSYISLTKIESLYSIKRYLKGSRVLKNLQ